MRVTLFNDEFNLDSGKVQDFSRRIDAVNELHVKLEKFGNILGHGNLEEETVEVESTQNESCEILENPGETEEIVSEEKLANAELVEPTE